MLSEAQSDAYDLFSCSHLNGLNEPEIISCLNPKIYPLGADAWQEYLIQKGLGDTDTAGKKENSTIKIGILIETLTTHWNAQKHS